MAANKSIITVTASVLPDKLKRTISGTATYNINDIGNDNKWVFYLNNVSTTSQPCIPDSVAYLPNDAGDLATTVDSDVDDLGLVVIKHTGYQGDGLTKTAANAKLYLNVHHGVDASDTINLGNMYLLPGEVWWGRFVHSDLTDIQLEASTDTINVEVYAVVNDGGI